MSEWEWEWEKAAESDSYFKIFKMEQSENLICFPDSDFQKSHNSSIKNF